MAAGYLHTVALTRDGHVITTGDQTSGGEDVAVWRDAVAVAAGSYHTVAVVAGGRVVAAFDNSRGQCDVASWRDVVAVAAVLRTRLDFAPMGPCWPPATTMTGSVTPRAGTSPRPADRKPMALRAPSR